ncbi:16S rRNA (guanine(527)-N(7))-methyltransferase RsmG [Brachybacterium kimchii]|uniref:Ribosomal RNA small subunit methyltransferase G n=1 Tax=Brachybacterium kimchii TaxID=2942909 RepID=A0ABY4N2B9_9MICO|nr:16S rRNA (guanine(527)-N(7))-methyltransferase RsmG [Brachybacterium kimchii]UQN28713.1 16S rRNA (guanine(527)-N(7))-methyltransferase RsmG [Brachybacterium kimchii]
MGVGPAGPEGAVGSDGTAPALPEHLRPVAERLLGDRLGLAERFVGMLATDGLERGLIGPREVDRLWERHLVNCALLADAIDEGTRTLADVGSGAGLPGVVLAIARPDLRITLIETMQRRASWLEEVAEELGIEVEVVRARAEDLHGERTFDAVTARAVAALEKLAKWTLPLVAPEGELLALKGSSAAEEIERAQKVLRRLGGVDPQVLELGVGEVEVPTTVVRVRRAPQGGSASTARTRKGEARG